MRVTLNLNENNQLSRSMFNKGGDVSFGISLAATRKMPNRLHSTSRTIAGYLNMDYKVIDDLIGGLKSERIHFLKSLSSRYHRNYYYNPEEAGVAENVINLFNDTRKARPANYYLIENVEGSFNDLGRLFKTVKSKSDIEFIEKLKRHVIKDREYEGSLIPNLFESPYSKLYKKHLANYASYLKLNLKNKNAVEDLDKLVASGNYRTLDYDAEYNVRKLFTSTTLGDHKGQILNKDTLKKHYSHEGYEFIDTLFYKCLGNKNISLANESQLDILRMFSTMSSKNIDLRLKIIDKFKLNHNDPKIQDIAESELKAMRELFDIIDNDKYAVKFVKKAIRNNLDVKSIREMLDIMDSVSSKKAYIFYNNLSRIVARSKSSEQTQAIEKGLMKPFYETAYMKASREHAEKYGFVNTSNRPGLEKYISNFINILRFKLTPAQKTYTSAQSLAETRKLMPAYDTNVTRSKYIEPITNITKKERVISTIAADRTETPAVKLTNVPTVATGTAEKVTLTPQSSEVIKNLKLAKRAEAIAEVNEIISKKLGKKTLDIQQEEYVKKMTKMRLKLLPEMFASVKDTMAFDRQSGRKIGKIKNADVVELYTRVNGKNRKLINYMLKKRNVDGSRMFSVKDITALLDKADAALVKKKQANPKMKAAEVKDYYNHIFDSYVRDYGKVKPIRKKVSQKSSAKPIALKKAG